MATAPKKTAAKPAAAKPAAAKPAAAKKAAAPKAAAPAKTTGATALNIAGATGRISQVIGAVGVSGAKSAQQDEEVAKAGSTGRSTGAHVHFEVWENGVVVNPAHFLGQTGAPVAGGKGATRG